MMYILEIKEEAKQDILQASSWYGVRSSSIKVKFIQQIEITLKSITSNPKTFKKIYKDFRQAALKIFPYVILYEQNKNDVIVFGVFHTSQHPIKKNKRLKNNIHI